MFDDCSGNVTPASIYTYIHKSEREGGAECLRSFVRRFSRSLFLMMENDELDTATMKMRSSINPGRLCLKPSSPSKIKNESAAALCGRVAMRMERKLSVGRRKVHIKAAVKRERREKSILTKLDRK